VPKDLSQDKLLLQREVKVHQQERRNKQSISK
jgi:hypothetical protein